MEFQTSSNHKITGTGNGLSEDASLVQSIVSNLLDSPPQHDEDKNFIFYFAELNANHHLVISYLKTFTKTKELLGKLKEIVVREETRALKIHGMSINVLHMCIVSLDPRLSLDMLNDDDLIEILCHFASLTKYYSLAIDIMRFALLHNVISLEHIVAVLQKEYLSTLAASVAIEAKGSPVKRVPSANFYALLRLLLHKPQKVSSESPTITPPKPISTLSSPEIAELDNDLECLRLIKNLCAFVEVDHRIRYPIDGMITDLHNTVESLKKSLTSGGRDPLQLQILWLSMRKFVEILNILLDLNYLEKDFATRCLNWSIFEATHGVVTLLLDKCPAILEGLRDEGLAPSLATPSSELSAASPEDILEAGVGEPVRSEKTKPVTDQLESACLLADLRQTLNAAVLSSIALNNELMIASPVVFSRLSALYLSKNGFFPTVLGMFMNHIGSAVRHLDNCEILREISIFLSYAQCSSLSKADRISLFDTSLQVLWDCCMVHLSSYCDRCIAGTDELDGSICRGIMVRTSE
jgi:hypothetical protein